MKKIVLAVALAAFCGMLSGCVANGANENGFSSGGTSNGADDYASGSSAQSDRSDLSDSSDSSAD